MPLSAPVQPASTSTGAKPTFFDLMQPAAAQSTSSQSLFGMAAPAPAPAANTFSSVPSLTPQQSKPTSAFAPMQPQSSKPASGDAFGDLFGSSSFGSAPAKSTQGKVTMADLAKKKTEANIWSSSAAGSASNNDDFLL